MWLTLWEMKSSSSSSSIRLPAMLGRWAVVRDRSPTEGYWAADVPVDEAPACPPPPKIMLGALLTAWSRSAAGSFIDCSFCFSQLKAPALEVLLLPRSSAPVPLSDAARELGPTVDLAAGVRVTALPSDASVGSGTMNCAVFFLRPAAEDGERRAEPGEGRP
jgi:hypothetical protein